MTLVGGGDVAASGFYGDTGTGGVIAASTGNIFNTYTFNDPTVANTAAAYYGYSVAGGTIANYANANSYSGTNGTAGGVRSLTLGSNGSPISITVGQGAKLAKKALTLPNYYVDAAPISVVANTLVGYTLYNASTGCAKPTGTGTFSAVNGVTLVQPLVINYANLSNPLGGTISTSLGSIYLNMSGYYNNGANCQYTITGINVPSSNVPKIAKAGASLFSSIVTQNASDSCVGSDCAVGIAVSAIDLGGGDGLGFGTSPNGGGVSLLGRESFFGTTSGVNYSYFYGKGGDNFMVNAGYTPSSAGYKYWGANEQPINYLTATPTGTMANPDIRPYADHYNGNQGLVIIAW